jgi:hypothetical protein
MGTRTHKTHHGPNLEEAITFPLIVYFAPLHRAYIQMAFLSRDSRVGVPKLRQPGLPQFWSPITLRANLGSRCDLKQSCSSHRELSNGMSHVVYRQVNRVDSLLFLARVKLAVWLPTFFGAITCVSDVQMSNVSPFWTCTFQELSNDIMNTTSHWVLTLEIAL